MQNPSLKRGTGRSESVSLTLGQPHSGTSFLVNSPFFGTRRAPPEYGPPRTGISTAPHRAVWALRSLFSKIRPFRTNLEQIPRDGIDQEAAAFDFPVEKNERRFRAAFSRAAVGVALTDLDGRFTDVNEAFCKITGYDPQELYSRGFETITHPEDVPGNLELKDQLVRGEREAAVLQKRYITKSGAVVWVQNSASVVRDEQGTPVGFIALTEDITERKRAEEALRQSEAKYRSLVEHSPYGICRTTPAGKLLMANRALVQLLGYDSEEELLTKDLARDIYVEAADRAHVLQKWEEEGADRICAQLRWQRKDGKPVLVNATARVVREEGSAGSFFEVTVEDITQRKILQDALRQAQRMEAVGQFAGGIAHDFNNLITIILGQSDMLLRHTAPEDTRHGRLREIRDAAERARWVTAQLLIYGRKRSMEFQPIDPNGLVLELRQLFERLIGEDILLVTDLSPSPGRVKADYGLLGQVMMNLVANARDAMPAGGTLTIQTASAEVDREKANRHPDVAPGSFMVFSVTDTGVGMDAEVLTHIFDPFFTTKGPDRGTGLGLAMVHSIVAQSGGFVTVSSQPGQGSTFSVFLPRVSEPAQNPVLTREEEDLPTGSETCLIVEDAAGIRALTLEYMTGGGYTVLEAANGQEALEVAQHYDGQIDLLVTDVVMPGMSGTELAACLAAARPEMKVLMVSGHSYEKVIQHGVMNPLASLLDKPFTQGSLLRRVREVLDR